jgi:hypothetical protein
MPAGGNVTHAERAFLLCAALSAGACGSNTDQGAPDNLPSPGQAAYSVDYIGSAHDTTYSYTASAITYAVTCIYLQTLPGQDSYLGTTRFITSNNQRPGAGEYPLRGLTAPVEPNAITAYSIYNGYSSDITGSIAVLYSTPDELGATFDFSAPTENQTPNFTVRIHGSFLAVNNADSLQLCP